MRCVSGAADGGDGECTALGVVQGRQVLTSLQGRTLNSTVESPFAAVLA